MNATPGPWTYKRGQCDDKPEEWFDVDGAPEQHPLGSPDIKFPQGVCMVYSHEGAAEANARLIAAVPELLAALKALYALLPDCDGDYLLDGNKGEFALKSIRVLSIGEACQQARTAIAKAEGAALTQESR